MVVRYIINGALVLVLVLVVERVDPVCDVHESLVLEVPVFNILRAGDGEVVGTAEVLDMVLR